MHFLFLANRESSEMRIITSEVLLGCDEKSFLVASICDISISQQKGPREGERNTTRFYLIRLICDFCFPKFEPIHWADDHLDG